MLYGMNSYRDEKFGKFRNVQDVSKVHASTLNRKKPTSCSRIFIQIAEFFLSLYSFCLGFHYPACPTLFLVMFFRRRGMECDSTCNVVKGIFAHVSKRCLSSCAMVFSSASLYVFSSIMPRTFSTMLRSGELANQSGFSIKFGKFRLHQFWVEWSSISHERRLLV